MIAIPPGTINKTEFEQTEAPWCLLRGVGVLQSVEEEEREMKQIAVKIVSGVLMAAALGLAGCASANRLGDYDFRGATLSTEMRIPPKPRLDIDFYVNIDPGNAVFSGLSILTNLAKANQASRAETAMRDALAFVDVPEIIRQETGHACSSVLETMDNDSPFSSDFRLVLDIHDWGINARSYGSSASLHMRLTASLYRTASSELLWSRTVTVDQAATPSMFGLGQIVGDMVTAGALAEMTPSDLAAGFTELARTTARSIVRRLERDLDAARS